MMGNITFKGNKSQCGRCGFLARIPDGIVNFKKAIETLKESKPTVQEDLQNFGLIIEKTIEEEKSNEEVIDKVEKNIPKLSFLAKYLPKNATELVAYLTVLQGLLGGGQAVEINPHIEIKPHIEIHINEKHVNETYDQIAPTTNDFYTAFEMPSTKIGRNQPCPCESGLKFKYCHGK